MHKLITIIVILLGLMLLNAASAAVTNKILPVYIVKDMFKNVSEARDITKFDDYYASDFVLDSNREVYNYTVYKKQQAEIFKTLKSLQVLKYNDMFASDNKVAGRLTIKLVKTNNQIYIFDVIFIAYLKDNKISRLWELTYPGWSNKLPTGK